MTALEEAREAVARAALAHRSRDAAETVNVLAALAQAKATFAVAEELSGLRADLRDRAGGE